MIPLDDDHVCVKIPVVTIGLLVLTISVFFYQISVTSEVATSMFLTFGFIPSQWFALLQGEAGASRPEVVRSLVTNLFLHAGWMHLIINLLYLWTFSRQVEDVVGRARFLVFYGLCGMGAVLAYACVYPTSVIPMVGASSAISGILGAYLLLAPRAGILLLMPGYGLIRVSAWKVLMGWFGFQILMSVFQEREDGGVGFGVHIAGFLIGVTLLWNWARGIRYALGWNIVHPGRISLE